MDVFGGDPRTHLRQVFALSEIATVAAIVDIHTNAKTEKLLIVDFGC
jgi:hypothetical protein